MEQKIEKFFFQIIAFEFRVANSCNLEQDICHQQSMLLTITSKISLNTRGVIFQIKFLENDENICPKHSDGDSESIWEAFTC